MIEPNNTLFRREEESDDAYIYRISEKRGIDEYLPGWNAVTAFLNEQMGTHYSDFYFRKKHKEYKAALQKEAEKMVDEDGASILLDMKRDLLYIQQVKTRDVLREKRKLLRDEARIDELRDTVIQAAANMPDMQLPTVIGEVMHGPGNEGILCIGDWHYGGQYKHFLGEFNIQVLQDRVEDLLGKVIKYVRKHNITLLHVINLGDMIDGNIHVSTRVQAEKDAIEQTMGVAELLAWFLMALQKVVPNTTYRSTLDNHSRINKSYYEHIEKENFGRIIDWFMEERFKRHNSGIQLPKDNPDENIGYFELKDGSPVAFVHGHLDKVNTAFQNLSSALRVQLKYVFFGHYHQAKMKEFQMGKVFVNGSLKGSDYYAMDNRYFGTASQMMMVMDGDDELVLVMNFDRKI